MNKINYDAKMCEIISENKHRGIKPTLLMHACCAPCASTCIERVKDFFDLTVYFYNPNIDGLTEYIKRETELKRLCEKMRVKFFSEEYFPAEFYSMAKGLEDAPEGGVRCAKCFHMRLLATAKKAKAENFDFFTTTLTLSPLKNASVINETGFGVSNSTGVKFLPSDFKKRGGYLRSIELSSEFSLYRQNYCGCEFSKVQIPRKIKSEDL